MCLSNAYVIYTYTYVNIEVPVSLPPVRVVLVDNVEDVAALEGDAELVAGDVQVVLRRVGEVCAVVVHRLTRVLLRPDSESF